jgi:heptaprenyl diphosphate synthase
VSADKLTARLGDTEGFGSLKNAETRKILTLLGAFCLFLSTIEFVIPKPMPFMRIGIANLPLMMALDILPFPTFLVLVLIKVLGQGIITGTLFSHIFLFSLAGTAAAAFSMYALRRVFGQKVSFIGVGAMGAMFSTTTQMALAWFFLLGNAARFIAPFFFAAGLVTGITLGVFCQMFSGRSLWYAARKVR